MNRKYRLKRTADFQRVRRNGISHAHPLLVLVHGPNDLDRCRIGIMAGKKMGSAVARNRAKRRLREAVRMCLPQIHPGHDLVFIARPALREANWEEIKAAVKDLLSRSALYDENQGHRPISGSE